MNGSDRSHMRLLDLSVTVRGACWCSPPPSIPCLPWWERVLTNGQIGAIALNGAALGFVAFLFAKLLDVKLGNRKTTAIIMLVVEVTAAIIGLIIMILMFRALYAA